MACCSIGRNRIFVEYILGIHFAVSKNLLLVRYPSRSKAFQKSILDYEVCNYMFERVSQSIWFVDMMHFLKLKPRINLGEQSYDGEQFSHWFGGPLSVEEFFLLCEFPINKLTIWGLICLIFWAGLDFLFRFSIRYQVTWYLWGITRGEIFSYWIIFGFGFEFFRIR